MKPSLRKILGDSHIAAIAIAVLLFWSLGAVMQGLVGPLSGAALFIVTAISVRGMPYSGGLDFANRYMLVVTCFSLFSALFTLGAAWLLSKWVYGEGPLRGLSRYRAQLPRRSHV
jgi:hypothetical protein